ncbi:c-type cytochrome [Undibacterium sp. CCC2.1]|nr:MULTISPECIES: c-type cytochrome [unclassified Undibacterium]MEB0139206.1 c-type cytochrome [Undibacterium sp. CCC2.1]MEB0172219.1 c-type cytochrome [Undibacterium sp. CCC1.1]MEB0175924.1 c-type cytochrome [Undibacterium sp. CCC3.4]MEB0215216.1 c-type cytochrome [Undibacterium sp. 5I2]WPX45699.1 c-type cytochrome [Undibacterium sp. CCC3.4]
MAQRLKACTACHGSQGRAGSDGYYPRIAGKPDGYLYNQLTNFRDGKRLYPLMNALVAQMSDAYLLEIAQFFSAQHPPFAPPPAPAVSTAVLERGRILVHQGDPQRHLPACIACHGSTMTGVAPFIPGLIGLPRDYLVAQLGAWQTGSRHAQAPDCMQVLAARLSASDIGAVSAWLSTQVVPAQAQAGSAQADFLMPLHCGSVAYTEKDRK